jgi:multidrug resistance efflux pump
MTTELHASRLVWKKLRRVAVVSLSAAALAGIASYAVSGSRVFLDADGLATRASVAVASPWQNARVKEVYVRPGDWVAAGQKIAVVESADMARSLADLSAEKARVSSRLAQLQARKRVVEQLLPLAEENSERTSAFLGTLERGNASGVVGSKLLQDMMTARVQAADRALSLRAELGSLDLETRATEDALKEIAAAYSDLQSAYGKGVLTAPASGYVGGKVAMVGEVLGPGHADLANIYSGSSFVLAYIPDGYLFDVEEGQTVAVKGRGSAVVGRIDKVLPVTEALPPEFQLPNRARERGQTVRVALSDDSHFAVDEKVRLTSCYFSDCRSGISTTVREALPNLRRVGTQIAAWVRGFRT